MRTMKISKTVARMITLSVIPSSRRPRYGWKLVPVKRSHGSLQHKTTQEGRTTVSHTDWTEAKCVALTAYPNPTIMLKVLLPKAFETAIFWSNRKSENTVSHTERTDATCVALKAYPKPILCGHLGCDVIR